MEKRFKFKKNFLSILFILILGIFFVILFSINNIFAVGEPSFCCEKTTEGAWCQNSPPATCAGGQFRQSPTSCQSTAYCKLGTCIDSREGTCDPNTPQIVCEDNNGTWAEGEPEEIPQCQRGCCLIGEETAFTTQTGCRALGRSYSINSTFRADINNELECIASANPRVKGACVYSDEDLNSRTCKLITKEECKGLETSSGNTGFEFHEGFLCSADSLATDCGPSEETTCVEDRDEVYFLDLCGNLANIYDASKINDPDYWTYIKTKDESCDPNPSNGNANSVSCGNCDYPSGSLCKQYRRGSTSTVRPNYGDFACADISCEYNGSTYKHGEEWCGEGVNNSKNNPGSEHFKLSCYNGEVTIEVGDSFPRSHICIQETVQTDAGPFRTAAFKVNRWQDCIVINNSADCGDIEERDCKWLVGESILRGENGNLLGLNNEGELVEGGGASNGAACVPRYPPGYDLRTEEGDADAENLCSMANQACILKFKKSADTGFRWKCNENCGCIGLEEGDRPGTASTQREVQKWVNERTNMCVALGDCGNKTNYIGRKGYPTTALEIARDIDPNE